MRKRKSCIIRLTEDDAAMLWWALEALTQVASPYGLQIIRDKQIKLVKSIKRMK